MVSDNQVLFAEISDHTACDILETLYKNTYTPLFIKMAAVLLTVFNVKDQKQLIQTFDIFANKLDKTRISLFKIGLILKQNEILETSKKFCLTED